MEIDAKELRSIRDDVRRLIELMDSWKEESKQLREAEERKKVEQEAAVQEATMKKSKIAEAEKSKVKSDPEFENEDHTKFKEHFVIENEAHSEFENEEYSEFEIEEQKINKIELFQNISIHKEGEDGLENLNKESKTGTGRSSKKREKIKRRKSHRKLLTKIVRRHGDSTNVRRGWKMEERKSQRRTPMKMKTRRLWRKSAKKKRQKQKATKTKMRIQKTTEKMILTIARKKTMEVRIDDGGRKNEPKIWCGRQRRRRKKKRKMHRRRKRGEEDERFGVTFRKK